MSPTLKLDHDDPEAEIRFELDFQASLTVQQRFDMMIRASNLIREMLIRNGHRMPVEIIRRA